MGVQGPVNPRPFPVDFRSPAAAFCGPVVGEFRGLGAQVDGGQLAFNPRIFAVFQPIVGHDRVGRPAGSASFAAWFFQNGLGKDLGFWWVSANLFARLSNLLFSILICIYSYLRRF